MEAGERALMAAEDQQLLRDTIFVSDDDACFDPVVFVEDVSEELETYDSFRYLALG